MGWEVSLIVWLQSFSHKIVDYLFYGFTLFGEKIFFIAVLLFLYWCVDKDYGFKFFNVYIFGTAISEFSKFIFKRPRPYVQHFDKVKSIIKNTAGYSFPSGHSQSISNITMQLLLYQRRKKRCILLVIAFVSLDIIVMISRMYLGQHYLTDVIAGAMLGILSAVLFGFIYDRLFKFRYGFFSVIVPLSMICTVISLCIAQTEFVSDLIKIYGTYAGFTFGYYLENKYIKFEVKTNKVYKYILRLLIGYCVALILIETLKILFDIIFVGTLIKIIFNSYIRYFLVIFWVSFVAPMIFKKLRL